MVKVLASLAYCAVSYANTDESSLLQARTVTQVSPAVVSPALITVPPHNKYCVVSGDPHIKPFDMGEQSEMCLGPMGDYYLVNTPELWIQGRYTGYKRNDGYAFVKGLLIGGTRLKDKVLEIPVENAGPVVYDGQEIPEWGSVQGTGFVIQHAKGPNVVNFVEKPDINRKDRANSFWVRFQDNHGNDDVIIVVNQGKIQNIVISGGKEHFGTATGQCGNINDDPTDDTIDVDECKGKVPCDQCQFSVCPNPECDKPRQPECCEGRELLFYRNVCESTYPKDQRKSEWTVWNCLTDCCADRENCPDQDNDGEKGSCIIRGDPHLKTFDSGQMDKNVYGPLGDYWLVNNKFFKIQGRYGSHRADKKASLQGVMVSGLMMGGMNLLIQGDAIQINGQNIYTPLDNEHFNITDHMGNNIRWKMDPVRGKNRPQVPVVTVMFKGLDGAVVAMLKINKAVKANVRKDQNMFFQAENWLLKGVTGQCGNYNGDKTDDASVKEDYLGRGKSMFHARNPQFGMTFTKGTCSADARLAARACCKQVHPQGSSHTTIRNCVNDNCGAGNPRESCKLAMNEMA